ncbi:MAG: SUMF1/EgtB/PvdO family nonheme iron enzyme, partial [Akkermansiaceae bacterium]|nr:SUMF1/EgtB/PvdO family nonheme iron enzyme [Akkermansiaceae bacterium]NIV21569.1 SUMF1/EgtB/PvdO family nonheme iron enzyme [Gammaproteobacteria bacterium]
IEYARHDLAPDKRGTIGPAQEAYPDYDWAMLAVWAWGGMRVVDYLETRDDVDQGRIAITGHSRGGKAALLAGALDERITLVAPCQSGAGGAGCSRILGPGAESIGMNDKPNWYHERIVRFAGKEAHLPFDQHFLKALVAPRGLLCLESTDDLFANPAGTYATSAAATPVFELYRRKEFNGLRFRRGGHSYDTEDWRALLDFAEWVFFGRGGPVWQHPAPVEPDPGSGGDPGFVTIGNPGNKDDLDYPRVGSFGAVGHPFEIGRRKVSNAEYAAFLNAVAARSDPHRLYHPRMKIRRGGTEGSYHYSAYPASAASAVTYVSWHDTLRYCNWLHGGDSEQGAYRFSGTSLTGRREADARFFLPTED